MRTLYNIPNSLKNEIFVKEPKVVMVQDFNEKAFKQFEEDFNAAHHTGQSIIPVMIDSYGGEVYSLMGMVSTIKSSKIPVATIMISKSMSCGAILFTCGNEGMRYMSQFSTLMIHDVSSWSHGKVEDIKVDAKEVERLNQLAYELMADNCGKRKKYFLDIVHDKGHADWFITADEALKHNITNHIGIPSFNVEISMKTELKL